MTGMGLIAIQIGYDSERIAYYLTEYHFQESRKYVHGEWLQVGRVVPALGKQIIKEQG